MSLTQEEIDGAIAFKKRLLPCVQDWYQRHVIDAAIGTLDQIRDRAREIQGEWPGLSFEEAMDDASTEHELEHVGGKR